MPGPGAVEEARRLLRAARLAATPARVGCLAAAIEAGGPVTRESLTRGLARRPDRVTVYRTLRTLEKAGLLRRGRPREGAARGEAWCLERCEHGLVRCPGHMHFECRSCGALECVKADPLQVTRAIKRFFAGRRRLEGVRIEAEGLCRSCGARVRSGRKRR